MFFGTYEHNLDAKNRISLPTRLRSNIGDEIVVSKGFDGCLELRTVEEFNIYAGKLSQLPTNHRDSRVVLRQIFGNAFNIQIDKANRILIPPNLLAEAKLKKSVTFVGAGRHIEIWDTESFAAFKQETDKTFESVAENLVKHE